MTSFNNILRILLLASAVLILFAIPSISQKNGCGQACKTLDDCPGQLICSGGKCTDDPDVGTRICSTTGGGGGGGGSCKSSGQLRGRDPPTRDACNTDTGAECCSSSKSYPKFDCSPTVSSATLAILTLNDFTDGGDGGGRSSCEDKYYSNSEKVVALSTGWFDSRSRCSKMIRISANGRSVVARVVDECDSRNGCDDEHGYQPPCRNNIVDASVAVWNALGVPKDRQGDDFSVTWAMA
ncbi:hypothetical protein SUGI_0011660 [Cryptomeria japonica]|nr:hypothetical protein SUGI_0011660 [Cryptomeria japonica]